MRRACVIVGGSRSSLYYRHKRDTQAILRQRIREIAETRVRWGYRRIHVLLKREGWRINAKRVHRLYCLEGLQLRNKTPDQPPRVVPLIVLVCDACLSPEVVPRGSTLPRGAGWRPALADVAPASYAA